MTITRRAWLAFCGAGALGACAKKHDAIEPIERRVSARIGVCAIDTGSGRQILHRANERFAMCSTFKWALAAAVLVRVGRGELSLQEPVTYTERDVLEHAPATRENLQKGSMTIEELARAAVIVSDNTAANLLLQKLGGPPAVTAFLARLGDTITRLDRDEPTLNTNLPGDPRDTTSPAAMARSFQRVLTGDVLDGTHRALLIEWLKQCNTGLDRLRAGFPKDWIAGDKTGTGEHSAVNDVAIVWPPGRAPIVIAAYLSDTTTPFVTLKEAHAEIGRIVVDQLTARRTAS